MAKKTFRNANSKIDRIMSAAFLQAVLVVEEEARKLMRKNPARYDHFVLAVGWGPTFFNAEGKAVEEWGDRGPNAKLCAKGRAFMEFATEFYDRFGADNRVVSLKKTRYL